MTDTNLDPNAAPSASSASSTIELDCPSCEATLVIDRATGTLVAHRAKTAAKSSDSINDILGALDERKQSAEKLFAREMSSLKDRDRLLEEKLQEAFKRAKETKDEKFVRPIDLE